MPPTIWALTVGLAGFESQAIGLAEAVDGTVSVKRAAPAFPWGVIPPSLCLPPLSAARGVLAPPWPDVVVSCGRRVAGLALAVKRASGNRTLAVHIQNPTSAADKFDLIVAPAHDGVRGPNVLVTEGAVHRVTAERLRDAAAQFGPALAHLKRPLVAVLVGGANRRYTFDAQAADALGDRLARLAHGHGAGLAVTMSRRTNEAARAVLERKLKPLGAYLWTGDGPNPYFGLLALADAIVVTADSVSMVSEAIFTGKPVYVHELPGGGGRFAAFHDAMRKAGYARPLDGSLASWTYAPPDDTARAAAAIRTLLAKQRR